MGEGNGRGWCSVGVPQAVGMLPSLLCVPEVQALEIEAQSIVLADSQSLLSRNTARTVPFTVLMLSTIYLSSYDPVSPRPPLP